MLVGLHVSIAGSIANAPENAHQARCECFQMFSRSPQGGPAPKITDELMKGFGALREKYNLQQAAIHTPYYINLASTNNRIKYGSITVIRDELERASQLGVEYVMTHLGSAKEMDEKAALKQVAEGLKKILDGYKGTATLLLENSAGAGKVIGDTFEDLAFLLSKLNTHRSKLTTGICFDTCHAFASGYDLRTLSAVQKTLKQFDATVGLDRLKLIHANDSKGEMGDHKDRHEHIGMGKIGEEGFRALIHHPALNKVNMILETPHDGKEADDIATLKRLRDA